MLKKSTPDINTGLKKLFRSFPVLAHAIVAIISPCNESFTNGNCMLSECSLQEFFFCSLFIDFSTFTLFRKPSAAVPFAVWAFLYNRQMF